MDQHPVVSSWLKDPEFDSLPQDVQAQTINNFFDKNLANDEFRGLPSDVQTATRSNFLYAHMGTGETIQQAPEDSFMDKVSNIFDFRNREKEKAQAAIAVTNAENQGRRPHEFDGPERNVVVDAGMGFARGAVADAPETVLRAGRTLGFDTDEEIKAVQDFRKQYFQPSFQHLNNPLRRDIVEGAASSSASMATGVPGAAVGLVGGPAGVAGGYALSGGTIYGLAEYDRFMEEAKSLGLNPDDVKQEAILAAVTEGGLEGVSNLLDMAVMKVGKPLANAATSRLSLLAGNYLKAVAAEVPTEMAQSAAGAEIRNEAGFPKQDPWEAAKDSIRPTMVSALGFAGAGTALRRRGPESPYKVVATNQQDAYVHSGGISSELGIKEAARERERLAETRRHEEAEQAEREEGYTEEEVNKRYEDYIQQAREENAEPFATVDLLGMPEPTVTPNTGRVQHGLPAARALGLPAGDNAVPQQSEQTVYDVIPAGDGSYNVAMPQGRAPLELPQAENTYPPIAADSPRNTEAIPAYGREPNFEMVYSPDFEMVDDADRIDLPAPYTPQGENLPAEVQLDKPEAVAAEQVQPEEPTLILSASGQPFKAKGAKAAATNRSRRTGKQFEAVEFEPGKWGLREAQPVVEESATTESPAATVKDSLQVEESVGSKNEHTESIPETSYPDGVNLDRDGNPYKKKAINLVVANKIRRGINAEPIQLDESGHNWGWREVKDKGPKQDKSAQAAIKSSIEKAVPSFEYDKMMEHADTLIDKEGYTVDDAYEVINQLDEEHGDRPVFSVRGKPSLVDRASHDGRVEVSKEVQEELNELAQRFQRRKGAVRFPLKEHNTSPEMAVRRGTDISGDSIYAVGKRGSEAVSAQKVASLLGKELHFIASESLSIPVDGAMSSGKRIFMRPDTVQPIRHVLGHELLHSLKKDNQKLYNEVANVFDKLVKGGQFKAFKEGLRSKYNVSSLGSISDDLAREEAIADISGDLFLEPKFWKELSGQDTHALHKFGAKAIDILNRVISKLGLNKDAQSAVKDVRRMRDAIASAMREYKEQGSPSKSKDSDVHFSRSKESSAKGSTVTEVEAAISKLETVATNAGKTKVVQSVKELPQNIQDEFERGGGGTLKGAHHDGTVYLVADNLSRSEEAVKAWLHEHGIHHGLYRVFSGVEIRGLFNRIYQSVGNTKAYKDIASKYELDPRNAQERRMATEEYLAHLAGKIKQEQVLTPREKSIWRKTVEFVMNWLREHSFKDFTLTPKEIDWLVADVVSWTMHGPALQEEYNGRAAVAFSRGKPVDINAKLSEIAAVQHGLSFREKKDMVEVGKIATGRPSEIIEGLKKDKRNKRKSKFTNNIGKTVDVGGLDQVFNLPHWMAKKFAAFKPIYDTQLKRMDKRSKMLKESLEEAGDFFSKMNKKDLKELQDTIWKIDGKQLDGVTAKKLIPVEDEKGRPVRENGREVLRLNPEYLEQFTAWANKQKVSKKVKDALISVRHSLDNDFLRAYDAMRAMSEIDDNTIKTFRTKINHIHNYFPHKRYGRFHVKAYGDNYVGRTDEGKWAVFNALGDIVSEEFAQEDTARKHWAKNKRSVVYREHFDAPTKAKGEEIGNQKIAELYKQYPVRLKDWSADENRDLPDEVYDFPVDVGAMEQIVNAAADKLDNQDQASKIKQDLSETIAETLKTRGWSAATIGRKGIAGHEKEDIQRVLYDYKAGLTGWLTKMDVSRDFTKSLGKIDAVNQPKLYDYARNYVKDMLRNADRHDRIVGNIKSVAFLWYLGFNLKTATVNLTQNVIFGIPTLGMHLKGGAILAGGRYLKAAWDSVAKGNLSVEEAKLLDELYKEDVITEGFLNEVRGRINGLGFSGMWNKLLNFAGMPMAWAERFNRSSLALAAFRAARDGRVKTAPKGMSYEEAKSFSDEIVRDAHFVYGKSNMPAPLRGNTMASKYANSMYTFRSFSHNALKAWANMLFQQGAAGRKAFAQSMLGTMAIGGFTALPFYSTLASLFQWVTGDDEDPTEKIRKALPDHDMMRDMVTYGAPAAVGVSLGGSIGVETPILSRVKPGATPKEAIADNIGDIFGIPYDLIVVKPSKFMEAMRAGDKWRAAEEVIPTFARNAMSGIRLHKEGMYTLSGKAINSPGKSGARKLSDGEAWGKGFGFQPLSSRKSYDQYKSRKHSQDTKSTFSRSLVNRFTNALRDGDVDEMQSVLLELNEWNQEAIQNHKWWMLIPSQSFEAGVKYRMREEKMTPAKYARVLDQQKAW